MAGSKSYTLIKSFDSINYSINNNLKESLTYNARTNNNIEKLIVFIISCIPSVILHQELNGPSNAFLKIIFTIVTIWVTYLIFYKVFYCIFYSRIKNMFHNLFGGRVNNIKLNYNNRIDYFNNVLINKFLLAVSFFDRYNDLEVNPGDPKFILKNIYISEIIFYLNSFLSGFRDDVLIEPKEAVRIFLSSEITNKRVFNVNRAIRIYRLEEILDLCEIIISSINGVEYNAVRSKGADIQEMAEALSSIRQMTSELLNRMN